MVVTSRRHAIAGALGVGTLGALAACTTPGTTSVNAAPTLPSSAGKPVRLTYWSWLKDLDKVTALWNAKHPNIQVEPVWIPSGNKGGYPKIYSALAAGGGPDLAQIEYRSIPEFMLVNGLVDLSRYGAEEFKDRFDETLWRQASFLDGLYGVPQDSGPTAMFYQPDVFEAAGAALPATYEQWQTSAEKLRSKDVYIDCFPISDASIFCMYATQAGAAWLKPTDDGWAINMRDEATMRVAKFFDNAIDNDLVTTAYTTFSPGWFAAASDKKLASIITASWGDALIGGVAGGEGKWQAAPMPTWGDTGYGSSFLGGSTSAVLANCQHPREALEFAVWLNSDPESIDALIKYCGIGWSVSPDYIGKERTQPSEFFGGQNYNEDVFEPALAEQNPDWAWWPVTTQSFSILSDNFRKKASGTSLVDGVVAAEAQIIEAFRDKGLTIHREDS